MGQPPANAALTSVPRDEVLIAILNHPRDLAIARDQHWYRIPVSSAKKWLRRRWPPQWLAFYQTKIFGANAYAIQHFARILEIREALRIQLLPEETNSPKARERYYQLILGPLTPLPTPILSHRRRRIVFITTTWQKFNAAREINDLYDESPLEDLLWAQMVRLRLAAERQEFITANGNDYALDFAFYCHNGKLDVETDGDLWHADPKRIPEDNRRDNDLQTSGWKTLRFNGYHLREEMAKYCVPTIVDNIRRLGGLDEDRVIPRDIQIDPAAPTQLDFFNDKTRD
jgi:very-short-patch-repair endonuclease